MKKSMLLVVTVLISISVFAQKVKIDKGEIKLDDKVIGYIEGKNPVFKISNLDKSYSVTAQLKKVADPAAIPWVELQNEATGKFNEIAFTTGKFNPFNYGKSIVNAFVEHNYLNTDGLNTKALENFINGDPTGVSEKLVGIKDDLDTVNNLINSYQLTIDDTGVIYSGKAKNPDPNDKRIGYIKMTSPSTNGELKYEVTDLDNYLIATWFARGGMYSGYNNLLSEQLITADQKVYIASFDNRGNPIGYKMSKDITAMNIVRALVGNGYVLQHQGIDIENKFKEENLKAKEEQSKLNKQNYEEAKLKSVNIYNKKGFVINERGEKITGVFKIEFEEIPTGKVNSSSSFVPGQELYQTDITDRFQIYQAKSGIRFCTDESKECFIGLTCKGENLISSGIKGLNADNAAFYKILYENEGYMVLVYPNALNEFIIKIPNQEKGLFTTKVNDKKLEKNIIEYFACDSFVFENHDLKTLDGLIKALADYKNNCKKQ